MLTYESHHFGENNNFSNYYNLNFNFPKHLHRSFELIYVKSGSIQVSINNRIFDVKEDQCLLILPYEMHSFITEGTSESYICVFSPEYIKTFHNMVYEKYLDNPIFTLPHEFKDLIINNIFKNKTNLIQMKAYLYLVCSEVLENSDIMENNKNDYELLHKALNYIQENFTKDISLQDIAKEFGYSYTYLSKYLNNTLGISFVDFINENRINYSMYLLKNTEETITNIAYICGYSSIRSFNRNFLKINNLTPKLYRKNLDLLK
ncbi:AraC family transcriptional regulator [Clostridium sp. AL.422]|uniref:AraC family transcriptional regulator n=1 Tax=Clostridium TaxID=1485 RepID=UPI00293DB4E9|nr:MULTISPECIES: AraC family transcriptional regulator [unclassified Clostridium]MDV4149322.1 AraC family transcriptional regulator [Clostridium sp. AL.422]